MRELGEERKEKSESRLFWIIFLPPSLPPSRYGLIGANGIGKTTLLKHIAAFEIEGFPRHHRVLHVKQEVRSSGKTVLETVLQSDVEREALMEEEREILARQQQKDQEGGGASAGTWRRERGREGKRERRRGLCVYSSLDASSIFCHNSLISVYHCY